MSPLANNSYSVFLVNGTGRVSSFSADSAYDDRPVVHLKSTIKIASGTGSSTDPFILSGN